ncbi:Hypothetical predicted protein [Scomber scombrus]|uniref:Uncharacterized protein n=1 Tax=Scomber scombrus TaxID=13677 RepID=A0AAV1NL01_SCOSC
MDKIQNNEASGPDTVKPKTTWATQALVLSSQIMPGPSTNCGELAGVRLEVWTEGFIERRDGGRKRGTRQGQGDGRSLGAEQLPISQLPPLNTRITEETGTEISVVFSVHYQLFFTFLSLSCP